MRAVYLDASAIVRWVAPDEDAAPLERQLATTERWVTSVVSAVEVPRALARKNQAPAVTLSITGLFKVLDVVALDDEISKIAVGLQPISLGTLDALHVATAVSAGEDIDAFITYDRRQADAAARHGLNVLSPE